MGPLNLQLTKAELNNLLQSINLKKEYVRYYRAYSHDGIKPHIFNADIYPENRVGLYPFKRIDCRNNEGKWNCDESTMTGFDITNDSYLYGNNLTKINDIKLIKLSILQSLKQADVPLKSGKPINFFPKRVTLQNLDNQVRAVYSLGTCISAYLSYSKIILNPNGLYTLNDNFHWPES